DMRRIIDRISSWNLFRKSKPESANIVSNVITEAATSMAEKRIGALIAIRGWEDWSRHIHGGIRLDGEISIPLLHSIFNTKAPGHDGAVLCEGNQIKKFGVHLPLSTNLYKMSAGCTRHTAALGLSELCDALLIVVSEERGTISIAKDGEITQLESGNDLKRQLDTFWNERYEADSTPFTHWWKDRSMRTALASVGLAFVLWLALTYPSETVYRTYSLPIEYRNLESTRFSLQDSIPLKSRVTFSGPEQVFRTLDPSYLVISFDLSADDIQGNQLKIEGSDINIPTDLNFVEDTPSTLTLSSHHFISKELPVRVPVKGTLPNGLTLGLIAPKPDRITVLVDSTATDVDSITTETINRSNITESQEIEKEINIATDSLRLPDEDSIDITILVEVSKD